MSGDRNRRRPDPDVLQRLRTDGLTVPHIGRRLQLGRAATYQWLRRYEIGLTASITQQALVEAWEGGETIAAIAQRTGLTTSAIRERLATATALPSDRRYTRVGAEDDPLTEDVLRRLYIQHGRSAEQVADATGTTPRQVRYRLQLFQLYRTDRETARN